jgi:hypothetical protein
MPVVAMPVEERKQPADRATARLPEHAFDAIVVVSFGGPEGMDDVMPFRASGCSTWPITTSGSGASARSTPRIAR